MQNVWPRADVVAEILASTPHRVGGRQKIEGRGSDGTVRDVL